VALLADTTERVPSPSAELTETVEAALASARPIGTELFVMSARFLEVTVEVVVEVDPYAAFGEVTEGVLKAIHERLAPVSPTRTGSAFGADFYPTSLYGVIQALPDVRAVPSLVIRVDGETIPDPAQAVVVAADQVLVPAEKHTVDVRPSRDR
jgi:hypothetical protein